MAKAKTRRAAKSETAPRTTPGRRVWRLVTRGVLIVLGGVLLATFLYAAVNPPTTPYMVAEGRRNGGVEHVWVDMEEIAPVMARSVVAAEDANFCLHWGLDVRAIRLAMDEGAARGGSTISQQVVKNLYLWQDRSWIRKAVEAVWTPVAEAVWSKRRILELYLNMIEFDRGVFGVQAAAQHYFGVDAKDLSAVQAARLAAVLPSPKRRSASEPSAEVRRRAASILDGAATIAADGRAACFEE